MRRSVVWIAGFLFAVAGLAADLAGLFSADLDHAAIRYGLAPGSNAITEVSRRLTEGAVQLRFEGSSGYLRSVLAALDIPVESQMLVFTKTSLQRRFISPQNPRAVYFNDRAVVAWVPGEPFVEVAAADARQGVIFYTVDQQPDTAPYFTRRDSCLTCHLSYASLGVPGMIMRSVFPAPNGLPVRELGDYLTDHRSPFAERWGGWYVTGNAPSVVHMGNMVVADAANPTLKALAPAFDPADYLTPYSDIVALMVFEHQWHVTNLITRIGWEVRVGASARAIDAYANELADYLLFVDEPPLPGPLESTSGFAAKFATRGPLREFDLQHRLMRYSCSYMIYSDALAALPAVVRDAVYRRIARTASPEVLRILRATKPGFP